MSDKTPFLSSDGTVGPENLTVSDRFPDVHFDHTPGAVQKILELPNGLEFHAAGNFRLRLTFLQEALVRIRLTHTGSFDEAPSYAIDPDYQPSVVPFTWVQEDNKVTIQSTALRLSVDQSDLKIEIRDAEGSLLWKEQQAFNARRTILRGWIRLETTAQVKPQDHFFGLGDKTGALRLNGRSFSCWNTDSFAYGHGSDPLYKSIPFFQGLRAGKSFGIFLDNPYRSHFEFQEKELRFSAEGGEMDYYFFSGPSPADIVRQYTQLTGTPPLPPMWALGFHQSRWSYFPEARVRELATTFRDLNIPCDAIYLDIDYMDGYRCFTWDHQHFPDPKGLIDDLKEQGFQTIVMIDPGIKVDPDYKVYQSGMEGDHFCRRTNGDLMIGPVWPQDCVFPDYTHPDTRAWWGALYEELYNQQGVAGFWNDMNEPAVFNVTHMTFPDEVMHHYEGYPTNHRKAHNIYGMQMARATTEGLVKLQPNKRPFLLTRAVFSGGQRYASIWTGDNVASWEHLQIANIQCQRLSMCGYSFCGSDVGGFMDQPDGELMVRWLQLGLFHPLFRVHSMGNNVEGAGSPDLDWIETQEKVNRLDQEPWVYGQPYTDLARTAIEFRYQLLPYLYTVFESYSSQGWPMLRSLYTLDPTDPKLLKEQTGFLLGEQLLVHPVIKAGQQSKVIYLPQGDWYDFHTGRRFFGGRKIRKRLALDHIPLFVKAGSVIPLHPVRQHTNAPVEEIDLLVFPGEETTTSQLFEDAGEGFEYQLGNCRRTTFTVSGKGGGFDLTQDRAGSYQPEYTKTRVQWYSPANDLVPEVVIDGKQQVANLKKNRWLVETSPNWEKISVTWVREA
jgi:alpha-glucosidase